MADDKVPDGAYAMAQELLEGGESPGSVEQKLMGTGMSREAAQRIIADHRRSEAVVQESDGRTEKLWGAAAFALGVLLTAVNPSGWGGWFGMIAGALSYLRGFQKERKSRTK